MRACRFSSVCCIYRCQFSFTSQSFTIASCQTRVHACRFSSPCCTYERHVWFTNQWFTNPRIGSHVINVSIRTFCVHVAHMNVTSHPRTNYSLSHHVTSYPRNKHSRTHVSDRISSICRHAPLVSMLQTQMTSLIHEPIIHEPMTSRLIHEPIIHKPMCQIAYHQICLL